MNKRDIEELQSFLQGDYIEESTSRSLKEVKQYQQTQKEITSKNKLNEIRKFLRKYLFKKTIRQLEQYQLHINKKDLRTDRERELYDFICNDLRSCETDLVAAKNKICDYLGIDKNMHEFSQASFNICQQVDANRIILDLKRIYGREIRRISSGIHLIHLTRSSKLTSLKPSTKNQEINRVYAEPCVFFFAVKASNTKDAIKKLMSTEYESIIPKSVRAAYEYIPKGNTEVFLDSTHLSDKQMKTLSDFDTVTPVFIKTRTPLPVKDVTSIYRDEFNKAMGESYIDETIERFDAFMEEFNNGQIGDSEFIMESVQDNEYAKIVKDYMKKRNQIRFTYWRKDHQLPKEVEDRIFDLANKLINFPPNGDYSQYKMYYKSFCKIVNYPCDSVIMGPMINRAKDGFINMAELKSGSPKAKRCMLKPGTHLFHTSENPNLTMLTPDNHFKGRENDIKFLGKVYPTGDYDSYYAAPRAYFHVEKIGTRQASARVTIKYDSNNMPIIENKPTSGHVYMYIVKPGDKIFFDPELNETNSPDGAVYMLINKPIKLIKVY